MRRMWSYLSIGKSYHTFNHLTRFSYCKHAESSASNMQTASAFRKARARDDLSRNAMEARSPFSF